VTNGPKIIGKNPLHLPLKTHKNFHSHNQTINTEANAYSRPADTNDRGKKVEGRPAHKKRI
jgi:hypothetical protein